MKKLALALISTAIAATAASANVAFTGPYAGLNVGMAHLNSKYTTTARGTAPALSDKLGGSGVIGGLELGYQKAFPNSFVLGLALNGDLSSLKGRHRNATGFRAEDKMRNSFGAALKLGVLLNPSTVAYAKVGVESAKWRLSIVDGGTRVGGHGKKRLTGFYPALGVETKVCDRFNAGIEGRFVGYREHKVTTRTAGVGGGDRTYKTKPSLLEARVKLSYQLSGFGF